MVLEVGEELQQHPFFSLQVPPRPQPRLYTEEEKKILPKRGVQMLLRQNGGEGAYTCSADVRPYRILPWIFCSSAL